MMKIHFAIRNLLNICKRYYSVDRDVLKLRNKSLFQDMFPEKASSEISQLLQSRPQCVYAGFDPTADSLHVGNLLVLINLLHWQRAGHRTIALIGGATAQIGDPSGRSTDRPELAQQIALTNASGIKKNIENIFKNHEELIWRKYHHQTESLDQVCVVNNLSWYNNLNLVQFLAGTGRHFRVGTMLSRHSVQTRLASDAGISFTEFSYQVFQAYDWLHLLKTYDCHFQIGGNDQMGNIVSGHDLISRTENKQVYGLTLPLVTSEAGDKFGKSAGNAVWLNAEKTSPFELYQFFIRSPDAAMASLLSLFTFLSDVELQEVLDKHKANPELRLAQKTLAEQVTLLVHGEEGLRSAERATAALYQSNIAALKELSASDLLRLFSGTAITEVKQTNKTTILELAMQAHCFPTTKDATRIVSAGGFSINHQKVTNPELQIDPLQHVLPNGISLLRVGKKNYYIVKWLS